MLESHAPYLSRSAVPPSTQLSQLFRPGIVRPITPADEQKLCWPDYTEEDRGDAHVEWLALDCPALTKFWGKGLFSMINERTGAIIDEHEEEWVEAARMGGVREGVRAFRGKWRDSEVELLVLLAAIEMLAEKASRAGVSLVFVL